jgi:hypothetical protein
MNIFMFLALGIAFMFGANFASFAMMLIHPTPQSLLSAFWLGGFVGLVGLGPPLARRVCGVSDKMLAKTTILLFLSGSLLFAGGAYMLHYMISLKRGTTNPVIRQGAAQQ